MATTEYFPKTEVPQVNPTTAQAAALEALATAGTTGTGAYVRAISPTITGTGIVSAMRVGGASASATSPIAASVSTTLASPATGSVWDGTKVEASTLTVTMGAGAVTITSLKANNWYGPTILTGAGAGTLTVTDAYTAYVGLPPVAGAGAGITTLTNSWSLGLGGPVKMAYLVNNDAQVNLLKLEVIDTSGTGRTGYLRIAAGAKSARGGALMFGETGSSLSQESGILFQLSETRIVCGGPYPTTFYTDTAERVRICPVGNLLVGCTTAGTSAAKTLVLTNAATAPSNSADIVHLYGKDIAAGRATLAIFTEEALAAETITPDKTLTIFHNGAAVKIPCRLV